MNYLQYGYELAMCVCPLGMAVDSSLIELGWYEDGIGGGRLLGPPESAEDEGFSTESVKECVALQRRWLVLRAISYVRLSPGICKSH